MLALRLCEALLDLARTPIDPAAFGRVTHQLRLASRQLAGTERVARNDGGVWWWLMPTVLSCLVY